MRISDWSSDVCSSDLDRAYIHFEIIRNHFRDFIDQPHIVDAYNTQPRKESKLFLRCPFGFHDAVAVVGHQFGCVGAVGAMYLDAVIDGDKAKYVITGYGVAAWR